MRYKYINNNELNVDNIYNIYNKMWKDGFIKNTKDTLNFKEYIMNNTNYKSDEIDKIINPTGVNLENRVDRYKNIVFYNYILELIKNYATKHQDQILLKYIELGKLEINTVKESLNDERFLKDNEQTINIGSYIRDFIFNTDNYIKFKNDKIFILQNLLDKAKTFDIKGNIIDVKLTKEQKEIIIKQYKESFDSSIKDYIENNPDEFEEIFIANSNNQFENLCAKSKRTSNK